MRQLVLVWTRFRIHLFTLAALASAVGFLRASHDEKAFDRRTYKAVAHLDARNADIKLRLPPTIKVPVLSKGTPATNAPAPRSSSWKPEPKNESSTSKNSSEPAFRPVAQPSSPSPELPSQEKPPQLPQDEAPHFGVGQVGDSAPAAPEMKARAEAPYVPVKVDTIFQSLALQDEIKDGAVAAGANALKRRAFESRRVKSVDLVDVVPIYLQSLMGEESPADASVSLPERWVSLLGYFPKNFSDQRRVNEALGENAGNASRELILYAEDLHRQGALSAPKMKELLETIQPTQIFLFGDAMALPSAAQAAALQSRGTQVRVVSDVLYNRESALGAKALRALDEAQISFVSTKEVLEMIPRGDKHCELLLQEGSGL